MLPQVFDSSEMCIVASLFCSTRQLAVVFLQNITKIHEFYNRKIETWHWHSSRLSRVTDDKDIVHRRSTWYECNVTSWHVIVFKQANTLLGILSWQQNSEQCSKIIPYHCIHGQNPINSVQRPFVLSYLNQGVIIYRLTVYHILHHIKLSSSICDANRTALCCLMCTNRCYIAWRQWLIISEQNYVLCTQSCKLFIYQRELPICHPGHSKYTLHYLFGCWECLCMIHNSSKDVLKTWKDMTRFCMVHDIMRNMLRCENNLHLPKVSTSLACSEGSNATVSFSLHGVGAKSPELLMDPVTFQFQFQCNFVFYSWLTWGRLPS